ncbi:MAG: NADP-dependent malic enzyme [Bacilli bacterium]|nr:NADP-dependent malic enzyme [Bacilli bacterium]
MDIYEKSLALHKKLKGKISTELKAEIKDKDDLSLLYSPGVASPCLEIKNNPDMAYEYTIKNNTVAIISDGSAVLGLGNIGGLASIPVMEGKAALLKSFAGINSFPICLDTQDDEEIIRTIRNIAPVFGGINLEDINAPRCFYIEESLQDLGIPVYHDDQHGTAIVVLAGLINATKLLNKNKDITILVNGLGSAGIAITKLLVEYGFHKFKLCDKVGLIYSGELHKNDLPTLVSKIENSKNNKIDSLENAICNTDVFIGVSAADILSIDMVKSMNDKPIVFALANPNPEISYENALQANVGVFATGRSDYPNQVNNVLVFPGLFKGALAIRAKALNKEMMLAAANALANIVKDDELTNNYVIPSPFNDKVCDAVTNAIKKEGIKTGVNQI